MMLDRNNGKSIDQQIKDVMANKVVGQATEIFKAVVLEVYRRITANTLQVGTEHSSPKYSQDLLLPDPAGGAR
jgi:hypothetical protein